MRGASPLKKKGQSYAVNSTLGSSRRGGCPPVAGESVHSNAGIHQVNSEWRGGNCCRPVAAECFWTFSFPFPDPRRNVKGDPKEISQEEHQINATRQTSATRRYFED